MTREVSEMDTAETILVTVLAESDAVWCPVRHFDNRKFTSNVWYARKWFPLSGVEWRSGGRTDQAAKELEPHPPRPGAGRDAHGPPTENERRYTSSCPTRPSWTPASCAGWRACTRPG